MRSALSPVSWVLGCLTRKLLPVSVHVPLCAATINLGQVGNGTDNQIEGYRFFFSVPLSFCKGFTLCRDSCSRAMSCPRLICFNIGFDGRSCGYFAVSNNSQDSGTPKHARLVQKDQSIALVFLVRGTVKRSVLRQCFFEQRLSRECDDISGGFSSTDQVPLWWLGQALELSWPWSAQPQLGSLPGHGRRCRAQLGDCARPVLHAMGRDHQRQGFMPEVALPEEPLCLPRLLVRLTEIVAAPAEHHAIQGFAIITIARVVCERTSEVGPAKQQCPKNVADQHVTQSGIAFNSLCASCVRA